MWGQGRNSKKGGVRTTRVCMYTVVKEQIERFFITQFVSLLDNSMIVSS